MRKVLCIVLAAAAAAAFAPGRAAAAKRPAPTWAGTCGLPSASPLWIDYGWPDLGPLFGQRGIVVGSSTGSFGADMRQRGAGTVYFDLYLAKRMGQPSAPADPSTIQDKAQKLYDFAVQQMGCPDPTIVENELFGAGLVTPWSDTNAQYRQNVLTFLQALAAKGAHPVLLVNSPPYTAGDAGAWWQQVAQVADIVREDYVPASAVWKQGPIVGNRTLRNAYRKSVLDFTSIGIPSQKLGIMVSFATTKGFGGRNGLQPASAWFEVGKWQALAAKEVAGELGIGSIWSWGWAEWTAAETDTDKPVAACVWLWARDPSLCDGPGEAGPGFDASRTDGQLVLPPGQQCTVGDRALSSGSIARLQQMTGDRDVAFTALYERLVESQTDPVATKQVLAAERSVIASRFDGSRSAYLAALAKGHASAAIARGILGDELRRVQVEATLPGGRPSDAAVRTFYESYPDLLVRSARTKRGTPWLGGRKRGLLISATAPEQLFTGGARTVWTPLGSLAVQPLGDAVELGAVPLTQARPAIVSALQAFARGDAFESWTVKQQRWTLNTATCARDELPQPGAVELSSYLPFLRLG